MVQEDVVFTTTESKPLKQTLIYTEEIESIAETYLNSGTDENAFSVFGSEGSFIMSPRRLQIRNSVEGVNGIPPEGVTCD